MAGTPALAEGASETLFEAGNWHTSYDPLSDGTTVCTSTGLDEQGTTVLQFMSTEQGETILFVVANGFRTDRKVMDLRLQVDGHNAVLIPRAGIEGEDPLVTSFDQKAISYLMTDMQGASQLRLTSSALPDRTPTFPLEQTEAMFKAHEDCRARLAKRPTPPEQMNSLRAGIGSESCRTFARTYRSLKGSQLAIFKSNYGGLVYDYLHALNANRRAEDRPMADFQSFESGDPDLLCNSLEAYCEESGERPVWQAIEAMYASMKF
ncbi:hypothetical protein LAZ40_00890 [Cereibacter sphaeroides]|uniref:hypothetical protein n=1 Tax=Cereibacter sphaeroides TaxID=1063 RepID=UPI001F397DC6|nr:hypothetical protein [Cereibacter sphaeroides]MCE6957626.1 hypothetical protein [Cereibacter sphaeroides]MCE6971284.1 hypothetical protein [Cereibacter sphaeroides]